MSRISLSDSLEYLDIKAKFDKYKIDIESFGPTLYFLGCEQCGTGKIRAIQPVIKNILDIEVCCDNVPRFVYCPSFSKEKTYKSWSIFAIETQNKERENTHNYIFKKLGYYIDKERIEKAQALTKDRSLELKPTPPPKEGETPVNPLEELFVQNVKEVCKDMDERPCTNCHYRREKMSVCSGCKKTIYCSETCQNADWPRHKEHDHF
jgi:hypothetical protein